MDNYKIGSLVRVEITKPGWETTIVSTITGMVMWDGQIDWHLAIDFPVMDTTLDDDSGFTQIANGQYVTTQHGLECTVTAL